LVLYDCVEDSVYLCIGQLDSRGTMMCFSKLDSFLLVERQPLGRDRRDFWVVAHPDTCLCWLNEQRLSDAEPVLTVAAALSGVR